MGPMAPRFLSHGLGASLLLTPALLLPAWSAHAAGNTDAEAAAREATRLTERAYELQRRGALNEAVQLYRQAAAVEPLPKRFRNVAVPLEQAGRLCEALGYYRRFQRDAQGEPAEHRADVEERVAALLPRLATLTVQVPADPDAAAQVRVPTTEAPGAPDPSASPEAAPRPRCLRDGENLWRCEPGPLTVELLVNDHPAASRPVTLRAGTTTTLAFPLRAPVALSSNRPRPTLTLDGAPLPLARPLPQTVPLLLGSHVLVARAGREELQRRFVVKEPGEPAGTAGGNAPFALRLDFKPSRAWVWGVVAGGAVVVAGVAVGVALGLPHRPGGADVVVPSP